MSFYRTPEKAGSDSDLLKKIELEVTPRRAGVGPRGKRRHSPGVDEKLSLFEDRICLMFKNLKEDIGLKFKKIESKLIDIHKNTGDIEKSMEFLATNFEEMSKKVDNLEQQIKNKQTQIDNLEDKYENLQRSARSSTLEIRNVPNSPNETKEVLSSYIVQMSETVGAKMSSNDIKDIFRVPGKSETNKPIIAELTTTIQKLRLIKAVKSFNVSNRANKLNAFHLGLRGHSSPVFVVEHLTSKGNRLHYLARELTRAGQYKYCWTSNGKVFVRKMDGAPLVLINSEEQMEGLKSLK
ncbi:Zinc finger DNA binding protein [Operophtera brumata]|uniref:Zinc finger DNA binding protein n=1 Tax=Operophtera brumata TaxID=104452 RepID=A0A0L7KQ78_OPEBR|nr:Zinc finger DNA binding protein [Operophtera brumata]